ncbi:hypothetical protein JL101_025575 [Skermanella rosea]|uniref:hypothetical protein n=1 Tax=Skermanella rosea TaxID=1817965 RepID=UPI001934A0F9|nr:hypothetical protein [Skermanella rosea]UEM03298.1 hypothetical protein JL101_025575 [Skermanella rosea]
MPDDPRQRLIALYAELAAHTEPECAGSRCAKPLSCCAPMYCDLTRDFALEYWGERLEPTWHPVLPFMGPRGCTVAPHLRPICTAHTCEVNEHGCKRGDEAWNARYFDLTEEIGLIEEDLFGQRMI